MKKKWLWLAVPVSVLALGLGWFFMRPHAAHLAGAPAPAEAVHADASSVRFAKGAPQLTMILSETLPLSPVPLADNLSARVAYDDDITARIGVGLGGRVVAIKAAPGDAVRVGQVLAEIDSPDFGAAIADLNKARVDEKRQRLAYERAVAMVPGEAIAAKDWEAAQADYAAAQAETIRAEQRVKSLNPNNLAVQGQRVSLISPISGVVTERTATLAAEVGPDRTDPLFVITDPRRLWLMIDLPESLLARVKLGSAVAVESDAYPGERFSAKIVQLGQVIDPNTRRAVVRAQLDNLSGKILPEMFVRAAILQGDGMGVRVPNSAIVNHGIYAYVFVETAPGEFRLQQVTLISRGGAASYVGQGLQGGERVVTKGALLLDAELSSSAGDRS